MSTSRGVPSCGWRSRLGLALAGIWLAVGLSAGAQAPALTGVVPANGATGVSVEPQLKFQFNVAMDVQVPIVPTITGILVGNLEIQPEEASTAFDCEWSADGKAIECTGSGLPAESQITWKLNPPGSLFPLKSAAGGTLATVNGSFRTGTAGGGGNPGGGGDPGGGGGGDVPTLVSANPAAGATAVPVSASVIFAFSIPMAPNTQVGGVPPFVKGAIAWTGVDATKFSYAWSADGKTLTCDYQGDLPGTTVVGWTLNPDDAPFQIQSTGEVALAKVSGSFTTGAGSSTGGGGNSGCDPDGVPDAWGGYGITKSMEYVQDSADAPRPSGDSPFGFGALVMSPTAGPVIAAASLSVAGGAANNLQGLPVGGMLFLNREFATETLLNTTFPAGAYVLRFNAAGQAERVVTMNMPAALPPTPQIANFSETQNFDPAQDFTLRWNAFAGAGVGDSIHLTLSTGTNTVFSAPDPCVPRALAATDTSIRIPANTFAKGKVYQGTLSFDRQFYSNTNSIPNMSGFGAVMKSTQFTISFGSTGGAAGRFTAWEVLPGAGLKLTLTGTPLKVYTIQRSPSLSPAAWTQAGVIVPDQSGVGFMVDSQATSGSPWFYRAVAQ